MNTLYKEEINPSFRLLVNKQLPLLKESGFSNYVSLVMCPTCQKLSSSENLQCMFLLMGGRNPVDSEPCSPINYYIHWLVRDPDSLPNHNQSLEMAQDRHQYRKLVDNCSAADGWWWRCTNMSEPCRIYNGRTLARNWSRPYGSAAHGHCLLQSNPALQTPAKYRHPYITDSFIYPNERKLMYFL